jgi:hypothetical protein
MGGSRDRGLESAAEMPVVVRDLGMVAAGVVDMGFLGYFGVSNTIQIRRWV